MSYIIVRRRTIDHKFQNKSEVITVYKSDLDREKVVKIEVENFGAGKEREGNELIPKLEVLNITWEECSEQNA